MKKKPKVLSATELQRRVESLEKNLTDRTSFWFSEMHQMHELVRSLLTRIEALEGKKDGAA